MRKYVFAGISSLIVIFIFASLFLTTNVKAMPKDEVNLLITKIDNKWKVVDASDTTKTEIKARRGYKITWTARGTDAYFQFMDEKLVGKFKHSLKDGKSISLNIGNNAKIGANNYAIFCVKDLEFAEGGSPPVIIVENN